MLKIPEHLLGVRNAKLTYVIISFCIAILPAESTQGQNAHEFSVLCGLAKTAESAKSLTEKEYLRTLADWDLLEGYDRTMQSYMDFLNGSEMNARQDETAFMKRIRLKDSSRRRLAGTIGALQNRVQAKTGQIKLMKTDIIKDFGQAQTDAIKAIAGDDNLLAKGIKAVAAKLDGSVNRGTAGCLIAKGSGYEAGHSLAMDMLCLCADKSADDKDCGFSAGSQTWATTSFSGHVTAATAIDGACSALGLKTEFTAKHLATAIERFMQALGQAAAGISVSNEKKAKWLLGKSTTSGGCDGTTAAGKCVDYSAKTCNGVTCSMGDIKWLTELQKAEAFLETNEQKARAANVTGLQAAHLVTLAETLLIQANYSESEPENVAISQQTKMEKTSTNHPVSATSSDNPAGIGLNAAAPPAKWYAPVIFLL